MMAKYEMKYENLCAMPDTEMEILEDGTVRVCKVNTLVPDINTYVSLTDTDFHNGTIDIDVCGRLQKDAPADARGFIGIVFRADEDGREFEGFYIRPTNGKSCSDPVRKAHGCQYFSFPGYTFAYFRQFGITGYEAEVNTIELNEWSHIKAVIEDDHACFYVDDVKVLEVNGMKHGSEKRGKIGLYVDNGTDGLFRNPEIIYAD